MPGRIESPNNSSTRDTGQQTTVVTLFHDELNKTYTDRW